MCAHASTADEETARICLVGDIYLGENPDLFSLDPAIRQLFHDADLVIANLEGPITNATAQPQEKICIKSAPQAARILSDWGVHIVTLANNHSFDCGWEGFSETRDLLDSHGIRYLGAGENIAEAGKPLIVRVRNLSLGLLAFAWGFIQSKEAGESSFGSAPLRRELMIQAVRSLKRECESIIVLPHWGFGLYSLPCPEHRLLAESLIDTGATAIVGCHAHVSQGVMFRQGRIVAFGLGNFVFAPYLDGGRESLIEEEEKKGIILELVMTGSAIHSYSVIPIVVRENRISPDRSPKRYKDQYERDLAIEAIDYERRWRRYSRMRLLKRVAFWSRASNWRHIKKDTLLGGALNLKTAISRSKKQE